MSQRRQARQQESRKERRALAREQRRIEEKRRARRRRVRRFAGWAALGTSVVAAGVVVALVLQSQAHARAAGPANMASDGILLTGDGSTLTATTTVALQEGDTPVATAPDRSSGVVDVVMYADYRDRQAAAFWSAVGSSLQSWTTAGYMTLELHPLALLDGTTPTPEPSSSAEASESSDEATPAVTDTATPEASATPSVVPSPLPTSFDGDYSVRAAAAMGCVAANQPDTALAVHAALLAAAPTLDADGMDTDELVATLTTAGASDETVSDCVRAGTFRTWAAAATARAAQSVPFDVGSVSTSPVILVGGQQYTGALDDADAFTQFISDVYDELAAEAAATATPTPEASTDPATEPTTEPTTDPTTAG